MATLTDDDKRTIARRWFDAVNAGDEATLESLLAPNVVDHSGLNDGHGGGSDGHKQLVRQLRNAFPGWESKIDDLKVEGDRVTINHSGSGIYPSTFGSLMGTAPADEEMRRFKFAIVSTVRIDEQGKIAEHWAHESPFGRKSTPGGITDEDRTRIARRWFDALNGGDLTVVDELLSPNVVDHSGLNIGHGGGAEGHKRLLAQLRVHFPDWSSVIDRLTVEGDVVKIEHSGSGTYPATFAPLMGRPPSGAEMRRIEFKIVSRIRIDDTGKIVEHWADQTPIGRSGYGGGQPTPPYPPSGGPPGTGTGTLEENKQFLQNYVKNVIDGQNPSLAGYYFAENFYNHDRAPGEAAGLAGVTAFLQSIFAAFSGFQTTIEQQVAEGDLVVGQWRQQFKNTGPYLTFPPSGREIHIGGITITRVRGGRIVEEWEARDALSLLVQMGVARPLGPLEGGAGGGPSGGGPGGGDPGAATKPVAQSFYYDAWDRGNPDLVDQLFAPDFVDHLPLAGQQAGPEGIKQLIRGFHSAFPDFSLNVDLMIAESDRVATRYTFRGTQQGSFLGIPATGKPVELTGIGIVRIDAGKIKELWGYWDTASLVFQLGLITFPSPPGGGAPGGGAPSGGYTPGGPAPGGGQPPGGGAPPNW